MTERNAPTDLHGAALSPIVAWTTSDPGVATVDATGLATGVAAGVATIQASSEGIAGTATLTVEAGGGGTPDAAPFVVSTSPADRATDVPASASFVVNFSESVFAERAFNLSCAGALIPVRTLSRGPSESYAIFPGLPLPTGATCEMTVLAFAVLDIDGEPDLMASKHAFSFTTAGTPDATPSVASTVPAAGATDVLPTSAITVTFSESVHAQSSSFTLVCDGSTRSIFVSGSPAASYILAPAAALPASASCTLTVHRQFVSDVDTNDPPNGMDADHVVSFTVAPPDSPPFLTSTVPVHGAVDVGASAGITFTFTESVHATPASFTLECPAGTPRAFSLSGSPSASFTLTPTSPLPPVAVCSATVVGAHITDADLVDPPDAMPVNRAISFRVATPERLAFDGVRDGNAEHLCRARRRHQRRAAHHPSRRGLRCRVVAGWHPHRVQQRPGRRLQRARHERRRIERRPHHERGCGIQPRLAT